MSETETETQAETNDDAVDIEPIIRSIIQDETKSTNDRLQAIEEQLGPIGELGETLEGLFKKNKTPAAKIDEDSLVDKIVERLTGNDGGSGNGGENSGGRKPGPLSRWLGISPSNSD